jgi:DNA-binding NarL/FixJ family response regulator
MTLASGLCDSDVSAIGAVNTAAMASQSVEQFEATVLPAVRSCFELSVSSLSNRRASLGDMPDRVVFCGVSPEAQARYQSYYRLLRNPVRQKVSRPDAETPDGIFDAQNVFEDSALREERLYREFHQPLSMDRSLAIKLNQRAAGTAMLGLWRPRGGLGFTTVDVLKLRCVAPVLVGAYDRLVQTTDRPLSWLAEILGPAEFRDAIVLLDRRGEVAFCNAAGEAALENVADGRASGDRAASALREAIEACDRSGPGELDVEVRGLSGRKMIFRAVPISDRFGGGYLVRITSGHRACWSDDALRTYLISTREVDVVRCAARGLSSKQIALELSISRYTVTDHFKAIYRKLGVSNRVELANLIAHGPLN